MDPEVNLQVKQLEAWATLRRTLSGTQRDDVIKAWSHVRRHLEAIPADRWWSEACGPLSAKVVTLLEARWLPLPPETLAHPRRDAGG